MSFESEYLTALASSITIQQATGKDMYGAPTFGDSFIVPGHVTYRTKVVRTDVESKALSTATVQIPPPNWVLATSVVVPRVAKNDYVTLPDDSVARHVLDAITYTDQTGDHHQTLFLT